MPKSQHEIDAERIAHWTNSPFSPGRPCTNEPMRDVGLRVASALEYIAAQLGQINMKLSANEDASKG